MILFVWPLKHAPESDVTENRHGGPSWAGECHAFFFLDRLADTEPDYKVPRWLLLRDLERRFSEWKERDQHIISDAGIAANDDVERVEASFLATGSPEAWRAWQETWPGRYQMPESLPTKG